MADVTMSLAELDKLRENIKALKAEKQDLNKKIVEIEADKRIIKITTNKVSHRLSESRLRDAVRECFSYSARPSSSDMTTRIMHNYTYGTKLSWPSNEDEDRYTEHKEFINLDDVQQELRKDLENKLNEELSELRRAKNETARTITDLKASYKKNEENLKKEFQEQRELANQEIINLKKRYADLKDDKDTRKKEQILEEKITQLTKELVLAKKKWYKKVF